MHTVRFSNIAAWLALSCSLGCSTAATKDADDFTSPVARNDAGTLVDAGHDAGSTSAPGDGEPDAGLVARDSGTIIQDSGAEPAPSCAPSAWAPGDETTVELDFGGGTRSYLIHVGETVDPSTPARLLVNFHGLNNSPGIQVLFSGMNRVADERGFIVVYPQGLNASFNAGGCCGASSQGDVDDLGFTRAIVADVQAKACIDPHRIYATGFSNGGYMSHHVGCRAADLFAAIAPVAGANATDPCDPGRPLPVFAVNADTDPVVAYRDGQSGVADWVTRNGCTGEPTREAYGNSYCDTWSACASGVEVHFCTWTFGTHLWPGAVTGLDASSLMWDFFDRFTLP